ncbi:MAG: hypothetical protein R6U95_05240, partial [Bacteroidales bacterium]
MEEDKPEVGLDTPDADFEGSIDKGKMKGIFDHYQEKYYEGKPKSEVVKLLRNTPDSFKQEFESYWDVPLEEVLNAVGTDTESTYTVS